MTAIARYLAVIAANVATEIYGPNDLRQGSSSGPAARE